MKRVPHSRVASTKGADLPGISNTMAFQFLVLSFLVSFSFAASPVGVDPSAASPVPTARQLKWQRRERALFLHFGMNTFTDSEWGTGRESPQQFSPGAQYSPKQWVAVAKETGFKLVLLTAKHHDGFCLWPSNYTNHSVRSSTWKNGQGDVVRDLVEAAHEAGIDVGLYLSPWDRHEPSYGDTYEYNKFYMSQLRELLTSYGTISEVWLDGNKPANATSMQYEFDEWFELIRKLQPSANIFSDAGPDTRWVGDEQGQAGTTCWSMIQRSRIQIGHAAEVLEYLNQGDESGTDWVPPECDVSIRRGWFWHKNERPENESELLDTYYKSVGRNCVLLLNAPPNPSGLIDHRDHAVLRSFNKMLASIFSINLASSAVSFDASSSLSSACGPEQVLSKNTSSFWSPAAGETSAWIQLNLGNATTFNVVQLQELIALGQRVASHRIDVCTAAAAGEWYTVAQGTTIGYKKLHQIEAVQAQSVRLVVTGTRAGSAPPLVASLGLYLDPYTKYSMKYEAN